MSKNESCKNKKRLNELNVVLLDLISFIEPYKPLLNTHNVSFLVNNDWYDSNVLTEDFRSDLEILNQKFIKMTEYGKVNNLVEYYLSTQTNDDKIQTPTWKFFKKLNNLNKNWTNTIVTQVDYFFSNDDKTVKKIDEQFYKVKKQNRFMAPKKVYEVDTMSIFVAKLCKKTHVNTVK
jgi:tellurite resistance-related uncharacterized protein